MLLQVLQHRHALHACGEGVPELERDDAQAEDVHAVIIHRPTLGHLCIQTVLSVLPLQAVSTSAALHRDEQKPLQIS